MRVSIVQALIRWCESNEPLLRAVGISLECVASSDTPPSSARVDLETSSAMWRVTVWDHGGMCDVEQLRQSSGELHYQHHDGLDAAQIEALMNDLVVRARAV